MIQPIEMKLALPMDLSNGAVSTTTKVWNILVASREGNMEKIKELADDCYELIYAQYNYTPPIHFAVREGHADVVKYLLDNGAHDPGYKTYPFLDSLLTIAQDRNHDEIAMLLQQYNSDPPDKFRGDNGEIHYERTKEQLDFQKAVDDQRLTKAEQILKAHPEFINDETFFWGEGIMMMPAKDSNRKLIALLMRYGAKVPAILINRLVN